MNEQKEGWICPVCKTVKAPDQKKCKPCSKALKQESDQQDSKQLLMEA